MKRIKVNLLEGCDLFDCEIKSDFSLFVFGPSNLVAISLWYIDTASGSHSFQVIDVSDWHNSRDQIDSYALSNLVYSSKLLICLAQSKTV